MLFLLTGTLKLKLSRVFMPLYEPLRPKPYQPLHGSRERYENTANALPLFRFIIYQVFSRYGII